MDEASRFEVSPNCRMEDLTLTPQNPSAGDYEHDYESFLAVQKKNKRKLAEVEGSMKKLLPLLERIRQTDELIDATVYRLYGLTEEEIGIVEGATRP